MMNKCVGLLAFALLAGCKPSPVENHQQDIIAPLRTEEKDSFAPVVEKPPRLPLRVSEAFSVLEDVAQLKTEGFPPARTDDSLSGGEALRQSYKNGMLDIYTMPDGEIWRINVTSGIGDRCGKQFSNKSIVQKVVSTIAPDADPSVAEKLFAALKSESMDEAFAGSIRFTASGGCLQRLGVTQQGALPD